jgi:hypothetical protein
MVGGELKVGCRSFLPGQMVQVLIQALQGVGLLVGQTSIYGRTRGKQGFGPMRHSLIDALAGQTAQTAEEAATSDLGGGSIQHLQLVSRGCVMTDQVDCGPDAKASQ